MRALRMLAVLAVAGLPAHAMGATITILNADAPGEGFNDPTPAAPVGGNTGTTLGEQRLIAFEFAASIWEELLDTPVEIVVRSNFDPLACTPTSATLGSASPATASANFDGALLPDTWYAAALANRLSGVDLAPDVHDLQARFNANLGTTGCLEASGWYLGLDNNFGANIDLVTVLLHEFAHGLGFTSFFNRATGALLVDSETGVAMPDVYMLNLFDNTTGKFFDDMTDVERQAATINPRQVVWTGENVTSAVPDTLAEGTAILTADAPASIAGEYLVGTAAFGPAIGDPLSGEVVLATDGVAAPGGGTVTDACEPIANAAEVAGKIALLDRGLCGFTIKVANAQAAGAIAVVVADNVAGSPPAGLGGADPTITIPSVRVTLDTGNAFKAALPGVLITLELDLTRRAGADPEGRILIFTPNPLVGGSSIAHWDTSATPNVLMEPAINVDLGHDVDLTLPLFRDIGWLADADLDGALDGADNCPTVANPDQADSNEDGIGNACPIRPVLECVRRRGLLSFTARFGYDNTESVSRDLAVGVPFNFFTPGVNRGQPGTFAAGRQRNVFEVNGSILLIWVLGERAVLASPLSPRCP